MAAVQNLYKAITGAKFISLVFHLVALFLEFRTRTRPQDLCPFFFLISEPKFLIWTQGKSGPRKGSWLIKDSNDEKRKVQALWPDVNLSCLMKTLQSLLHPHDQLVLLHHSFERFRHCGVFANLADENSLIFFAFLTLVPLHHLICLRDYFTESKTIK